MRLLDVHPGLLPRRSGQAVAPGRTSRVVAPRGLPLRDSAGVPPASRLRHGGTGRRPRRLCREYTHLIASRKLSCADGHG
jgi:hypothetical protein